MMNLASAYSTSVALHLALESQNAEQDRDLARCMRLHVTAVIADQIESLIHLADQLGVTVRAPS